MTAGRYEGATAEEAVPFPSVFCEGVSPKKSLVKIGEPSHTRRFASERGEFSPNGS
jgi:hypothetical protein